MKYVQSTRIQFAQISALLAVFGLLLLPIGCGGSAGDTHQAAAASQPRVFLCRLTPSAVMAEKGFRPVAEYSVGKTAIGTFEGAEWYDGLKAAERFSGDSLDAHRLPADRIPVPMNTSDATGGIAQRIVVYERAQATAAIPAEAPLQPASSPTAPTDAPAAVANAAPEQAAPAPQKDVIAFVLRLSQYPLDGSCVPAAPGTQDASVQGVTFQKQDENTTAPAPAQPPVADASASTTAAAVPPVAPQSAPETEKPAVSAGEPAAVQSVPETAAAPVEAKVTPIAAASEAFEPRFQIALPGLDITVHAAAKDADAARAASDELAGKVLRIMARDREIRTEIDTREKQYAPRLSSGESDSFLHRLGRDQGLFLKKKF